MNPPRRQNTLSSKARDDSVPEVDMKAWRLDVPKLDDLVSDDEDDDGDTQKRNNYMDTVVANYNDLISSNDEYNQIFAKKHYTAVTTLMEADEKAEYNQGTLLHNLVSQLGRTKQWKLWVKFILDVAMALKISILVAKSKNNSSTCLHDAIQAGKADFIQFLGEISGCEDMSKAIAATNGRLQNCVHLAIEEVKMNTSNFRLVDYLTKMANPDTLKTKRAVTRQNDMGAGNTCLHDLVNIRLCKAYNKKCSTKDCPKCQKKGSPQGLSDEYATRYLDVLRTMAARCPSALRTMNEAEQSPFLFHVYTRSQDPATKAWSRLELSHMDENVEVTSRQSGGVVNETVAKKQGPSIQLKNDTGINDHKKPEWEHSQALATNVAKELMELCLSQLSFANVCDGFFGHSTYRS